MGWGDGLGKDAGFRPPSSWKLCDAARATEAGFFFATMIVMFSKKQMKKFFWNAFFSDEGDWRIPFRN